MPEKALDPVHHFKRNYEVPSLRYLVQKKFWTDPKLKPTKEFFWGTLTVSHLIKKPSIVYSVSQSFDIEFEFPLNRGRFAKPNYHREGMQIPRHIPVQVRGLNGDRPYLNRERIFKHSCGLWYFTMLPELHSKRPLQWQRSGMIVKSTKPYEYQLDVLIHFRKLSQINRDPRLPCDHFMVWSYTNPFTGPKDKSGKSLEQRSFYCFVAPSYAGVHITQVNYRYQQMQFELLQRSLTHQELRYVDRTTKVIHLSKLSVVPQDTPMMVYIGGDILNKDSLPPDCCIETGAVSDEGYLSNLDYQDENRMVMMTGNFIVYKNALLEVEIIGQKPIHFNVLGK